MNQYRCTHNSVCSRTDIDDRGNHAVCESSTDCEDFCSHQSERDKVLDEVLQLPQRREQPNGSMYIYVNDVKELRQKVGD